MVGKVSKGMSGSKMSRVFSRHGANSGGMYGNVWGKIHEGELSEGEIVCVMLGFV